MTCSGEPISTQLRTVCRTSVISLTISKVIRSSRRRHSQALQTQASAPVIRRSGSTETNKAFHGTKSVQISSRQSTKRPGTTKSSCITPTVNSMLSNSFSRTTRTRPRSKCSIATRTGPPDRPCIRRWVLTRRRKKRIKGGRAKLCCRALTRTLLKRRSS